MAVILEISGGKNRPLIHTGKGSHAFSIFYDFENYSGVAVIEISLSRFGDGSAIFVKSLKATSPSGEMSFRINIPAIGFYEYGVALKETHTGKILASEKRNVSVIPGGIEKINDMGVCTHFAQNKGSLPYSFELIAKAGFSSIRDEIYWSEVESEKDTFVFPQKYDDYISASSESGIEPLVVLGYGNPKGEPVVERGFPVDSSGRQRFVRYVSELVERYGKSVPYWELWNEPSPSGGIDPVTVYYPLLREVYEAVKGIIPDADVISSGGAPNHVDGAFIRPILDMGGVEHMDGFAMHTYVAPYTPEDGYETRGSRTFSRASIPAMWNEYGRIAEKYSGSEPLKVWVTEIGWHNAFELIWNGDKDTVNIDDLRQAAYITRMFLLSRRHGNVKKVYLYDFQNDGDNPEEREDNFGLIRTDFAPKAGYQAVAVMASVIGNRRFSENMMEDSGLRAYIYGERGDRVAALWSVNEYNAPLSVRNETFIELKASAGKVRYIDWQGKETVFRSRNHIFRIPVSEIPGYVILDGK